MGKNQKYSIDFKLEVTGKYVQGKCGYKRLAREYCLSRDTVRAWCLNPKLRSAREMAKNHKINNEEKDLEYYKTAALFWETYAKNIEEEIAKQRKKKLLLRTMDECLKKNPETKARKLCEVVKIPKSTFYYNRGNHRKEEKDAEVIVLIKRLPEKVRTRRGSKPKVEEIKNRFGIVINHKKIARICAENGLLAKNRRRKFPKNYYKQQKENKKNLPKNILNRNFSSDAPLRKLCSDVSYFATTEGWLYLSPVMDLYRNRIITWQCSKHNDNELAYATLNALEKCGNLSGAILHTDQGVLYTAKNWRERLVKIGITQSMSRRGNCWDNACMEHFFGTLKVESNYDDILKSGKLLNYKDTKKLIDNFIVYYNNERIQKKLGWQAPYKNLLKLS